MWRFIAGCIVGVYVGSHYDCKPAFKYAKEYVEKTFPEKKK